MRALGGGRLFAGRRVLEVGVGEGRLLWAYGAAARSVLAIDPDADAVGLASERAHALGWTHVSFAVAPAQRLDAGAQRFDLALLSWSL